MIATTSNDNFAGPTPQAVGIEYAHEVCTKKPASGQLEHPPADNETADAYLARLLDEQHDVDALRFMAIRLGPRAAVWWGALAVWNSVRDQEAAPTGESSAAIDAAVRWVIDPTESHRQHAKEAGAAAGLATAAGVAATAAFWSGGSISLPGQPAVQPLSGVCEKLVANSVQMAATPAEPGTVVRPFLPALRIGAEVLAGANRWPAADLLSTEAPANTDTER